jgi:hypothetical protein
MRVFDIPVAPWQDEFVNDPCKSGGVIGGVVSGKTFIGSDWVTLDRGMVWPHSSAAIIAATRKQLKEGTLVTFMGRLDELGIRYRQHLTDLSIKITSKPWDGHRIQGWSVENKAYLRLKSLEFDTILCDELQIWEAGRDALSYIFTRNRPSPFVAACIERVRRARAAGVEPSKRDLHYAGMQPQLRFLANPPWTTTHWLHTTYVDPVDEEDDKTFVDDEGSKVKVWRVTIDDNPLVPRREEIKRNLRQNLPADVYRIEVLGESGDVGVGRAYTSFYKSRHTKGDLRLPSMALDAKQRVVPILDPTKGLAWVHDFGVNPRVWLICQVHRLKKKVPGFQETMVYVLDEATIFGGDTLKAIATFVERYPHKEWPRIFQYGDATGEAPHSPTGQSDWGLLRSDKRLAPYRISYHYPAGNPPIVDRVVSVNTKFLNADDEIGVIVHPRCKHFITDAQQTRWVEGPTRKLDHGSRQKQIFRTHWTDGFGYFVVREWPITITKALRRVGQGTTVR